MISTTVGFDGEGIICDWLTQPGWLKSEASEAKCHQFRWPMLNIWDLSTDEYEYCTLRSGSESLPGFMNAGDRFTMCDDDLQAYVDQLIPPPGATVSQALNPDSFETGRTLTGCAQLVGLCSDDLRPSGD